MNYLAALLSILVIPILASGAEVVRLAPGFVTKLRCEGRLLVSAVGSDELVQLEALPKELGCGVLLKPKVHAGRTNLFLETTAGTIERALEIAADQKSLKPSSFEIPIREVRR